MASYHQAPLAAISNPLVFRIRMGTVADATWGTVWPCISPYPLSPLLRRVFHPSPPPLCHPSQLLLKAAQPHPAARLPRPPHVHPSPLPPSPSPPHLHSH